MGRNSFDLEVGKRMRKARQSKGITQDALAHDLGYRDGTTIHYWENARTPISLHNAVRVADALGVTVSWLVATTMVLVERGEDE